MADQVVTSPDIKPWDDGSLYRESSQLYILHDLVALYKDLSR